MLDHVVLAAPDLARAVEGFAARTGVEPVRGGSHPGLGTANYLVGLGTDAYLEIIGPDPDQPTRADGRWFRVDEVTTSCVVTWALRTSDLDSAVSAARAGGYDPGAPVSMSRTSPAGNQLQWRLTPPRPDHDHGLVPFLIDWGTTQHPTALALPSVRLVSLTGTHPDPARVGQALTAVGASLRVDAGEAAGLILRIETPRGNMVFDGRG